MSINLENAVYAMQSLGRESYYDLSSSETLYMLKAFCKDNDYHTSDVIDCMADAEEPSFAHQFADIYGISLEQDCLDGYFNLFFEFLKDKKVRVDREFHKTLVRALEFEAEELFDTHYNDDDYSYHDDGCGSVNSSTFQI